MSEEEIIRICKLICGTKNKKGKRKYKTIERMNLLRDYNEDTLEDAIQGLLDLYNKEKRNNVINETHIELFERSYKELAKKLNINSCIITENIIVEHIKENYISKDKIREKLDYQYSLWNSADRQKEYSQEYVNALEELLEGE